MSVWQAYNSVLVNKLEMNVKLFSRKKNVVNNNKKILLWLVTSNQMGMFHSFRNQSWDKNVVFIKALVNVLVIIIITKFIYLYEYLYEVSIYMKSTP